MRTVMKITLAACTMLLAAPPAWPSSAIGIRGGLGLDPDQGVVGLQGQFAGRKLKVVRIAPSVDFGFGDDVTTIAGNLDFIMLLSPPESRSAFYAGAGPTLTWWDFDNDAIEADTEIGLSLLGGVRFATSGSHAYTAEFRFGIGDIPEIRILVGFLFGGAVDEPQP